jgi:tRNA wybutosine-synthesizing protein 4
MDDKISQRKSRRGSRGKYLGISFLKLKLTEQVIVHDATAEHMNFNTKNFSYVAKRFGDFLEEVEKGQKLYLRSLSSERPSELPANISRDFPSIAADFRLPPELSIVTENAHSSPLRISGPVTMWLHYDVGNLSMNDAPAN